MSKTQELFNHWQKIIEIIPPITCDIEYQERLELLHGLIDDIGEDEQHPLASLLHYVGVQLECYEENNSVINL